MSAFRLRNPRHVGVCPIETCWLLLLVSILLLSGCTNAAPVLRPLPDLHVPGVAKIPGSMALVDQYISHQITSIATYQGAGAGGGSRLLALLGGSIYDMGLDGSNLHKLRVPIPCQVSLSVTRDSSWGACQTATGIEIFGVGGATPQIGQEVLHNPSADVLRSPTWAPDNQHLAVSSRRGTGSIAIYALSPTYTTARLTARLVFSHAFVVDSLLWSRDENWLTVSGGASLTAGISLK